MTQSSLRTSPLIQYQIDAFADRPFCGNPAAVIVTPAALDAGFMQKLAQENNLSETAFLVPRAAAGHYNLRWFTPTTEIEFCGHATIASAHALMVEMKVDTGGDGALHFHTHIGALTVSRRGVHYVLTAPITPARAVPISEAIKAAFPVPLKGAFRAGHNLYIVFETAADIETLTPDFSAIAPLSDHGVGITAQTCGDYDCISRFFVPAQGIDEDPVTGSAHAAIGPYWAQRSGKTDLTAYQASARGGVLHLSVQGDAINIAGPAVTVMKSELYI